MAETQFDSAINQFSEHYGQMRGYIREQVTRQNLADSVDLDSRQLRVLDLEGGAGRDANWLAGLGHKIVLIDSSPKQLTQAYAQPNLSKASIIEGNVDTALKLYGPTGFDLVLSHGVLLYQERPGEYLKKLSQLVRPLGALSLLTAGKYGKLERLKKQADQAAVDRFVLTSFYTNNLGLKARAHLPTELDNMLRAAGLETEWFGVRINSDEDNRALQEVPAFHRNRQLGEELRLSRDKRMRAQGQLLHFTAKKLN